MATLRDLQEHYDVNDLFDLHEMLDIKIELEAKHAKKLVDASKSPGAPP
jgi:hypothetical protein